MYIFLKKTTSMIIVTFMIINVFCMTNAPLSATMQAIVSPQSLNDNTSINTIGLEDGETYYILNAFSLGLMAPDTTNPADYANVITDADPWTAQTQWLLDQQSDGRFKIKSFAGSSGVLLKVFGTSVEVETDENDDSVKFTIERITGGDLSGLYYIKSGNYYLTRTDSSNVCLSNVTDSRSCWSFMNVEKGDADFFSFTYNNINTTPNQAYCSSIIESFGYDTYLTNNASKDFAYEMLKTYDDIFVYMNHSVSGAIGFNNSSGTLTGSITVNEITYYGNNMSHIEDLSNNRLSHVRMVLYLGCDTGTTYYTYNLVDATFEKGAHFVLGIPICAHDGFANEWLKYFIDSLDEGLNIMLALSTAEFMQMQYGNYFDYDTLYLPVYHKGDTIQFIKF